MSLLFLFWPAGGHRGRGRGRGGRRDRGGREQTHFQGKKTKFDSDDEADDGEDAGKEETMGFNTEVYKEQNTRMDDHWS